MKENLGDVTNALIKWIVVAVVLITPLLFSPWTFDFFEFPKQVFLWQAAAILLVLWLFGFVLDNEVRVVKTPLDLPLLLFLLVAIIGTLLSSSQYISITGFFGRPDGSLSGIVAYTTIFYVAASRFKSMRDVLHVLVAFLASASVVALLGLFYYFGAYILPWKAAEVRTFSPAGGAYALTLLLSMAAPLGLGLLIYLLKKDTVTAPSTHESMSPVMDSIGGAVPTSTRTVKTNIVPLLSVLLTLGLILFLGVITMFGIKAAWFGTLAGLAVFFLWSKRGQLREAGIYLLALFVAVIFWVILITVGPIKQTIPGLAKPVEAPQTLSARESWFIAGNTIRDLPFLGSGPATFLFDFTRYRSTTYNLSENWNTRFIVAHNQYLQTLATLGVLGLLAYLFLLFRVALYGFRTALTNRETSVYPLKVGVFAAIVAFIVATIFTVTTTTAMLGFFILLALFMALERIAGSHSVSERRLAFVLSKPASFSLDGPGATSEAKATNAIPLMLFIPGLLLAIGALFLSTQHARANYYYVKGVNTLSSNQPNSALQGLRLLEKATLVNKREDAFRRDLAKTSFNLALAISARKDITEEDKKNVTRLLEVAIGQAQRAAALSPLNVNNWETLADIYRRIAGQVKGAGDVALQAFARAIQADPPNPKNYLDLGGIYYAANANDRAIQAFQRAVELKPNLANARYNLANAYVKKGEFNNALVQYQLAKQIIDSLDEKEPNKKQSSETLDKEMAAIKDKVSTQSGTVAGEQDQQSALQATPQPSATAQGTPRPFAPATPAGRATISPNPPANTVR